MRKEHFKEHFKNEDNSQDLKKNNSHTFISIVIELNIIAASVTVLIKNNNQTSKVHLSFK